MRKGELNLTSGFGSFLLRNGDGDEAGDNSTDISGVAVGEGLEGNGDASAGGFRFNEDGTGIDETKESLTGVAMASAPVKQPSLARARLRLCHCCFSVNRRRA